MIDKCEQEVMTHVFMKKDEKKRGVFILQIIKCAYLIYTQNICTKQYTNHLLPRRSLVVRGIVGEG